MITEADEKNSRQDEPLEADDPLCACIQDPFAALPPELRPTRPRKKSLLRTATCPECGFVLWTNRSTDLCAECEKKAQRKPVATRQAD
jgi:hypothetical protein